MTIILDNFTVPEKGRVEIKIDRSFEIKVTAEEARRKVDRWLLEYVSVLIGAEPPALIMGARVVWRVPARISFSGAGPFQIGTVDVDVETGDMGDLEERKAAIIRYLEEEVKPRLPPNRRQVREVPPEYIPKHIPPARVIVLADKTEDAAPEAPEE